MRVGYLGPEGTFTHEAVMTMPGVDGHALEPLPTVYETVMAVHEGTVDRALVPIENSLEGSVNATLDALAVETEDVRIVGEAVHPIRHCLIAREQRELDEIDTVVSHPQASAQCARFIRSRLRGARVVPASSTAEAVRIVAEADGPWAALGNRLSAGIYGCEVLRAGIEDTPENETRFVWLARAGAEPAGHGPWKTSIVFWGVGDDAPGWLVRCLSEFAFRGVNLTKIESRPARARLGHYLFLVDLHGAADESRVHEAIEALRAHCEQVRVLGSYPAAPDAA
jgi:prephenate dehydratase